MISKRHCAILQREAKAFIRDFGSTNGTFVNNEPIKGEIELRNGDQLKIGPLLFEVRLEVSAPVNRPTPPPPTKPATKTIPAVKASTPVPGNKAAAKPAAKEQPAKAASQPAESEKPAATAAATTESEESGSSNDDDIAAMLLSLHDEGDSGSSGITPEVPEGSTVHELPLPSEVAAEMAKNEPTEKPKVSSPGNTSQAAKSILEKYMKRPRG